MGRILMIEFNEKDAPVFDEVMEVLKRYPNFENLQMSDETTLS